MKSLLDFTKIKDFDDHIRRSIPTVDEMYKLCHQVTYAFSQTGTRVVDLGCSTGKFLIDTQKRIGVEYIGVDHFKFQRGGGFEVDFRHEDAFSFVRHGGVKGSSVVSALFTLQFLPYKTRVELIERTAEGLVDGGCMIVAEKVHLADAGLAEVIERDLIDWKRRNFDDKDILDKSAQLAGSMRRQPQADLIVTMQRAFNTVSVIWAHGQFMCVVGVK